MLTSRLGSPSLDCYVTYIHLFKLKGGKLSLVFKNPMDLRVFVLICLAAASRHQPSSALEVEEPQHPRVLQPFNEPDFQRLRDDVNSGDFHRMFYIAPQIWPFFLKAHPEEGWHLFEKLATDEHEEVRKAPDRMQLETRTVRGKAAMSPAWPVLLETRNAEAWHLFEQLAKDKDKDVRGRVAKSPAWPMLLETHNAKAWQFFEKLATDESRRVREEAAESSAWFDLVKSNPWEAWRVFAKLMSHQEFGGPELFQSPAWEAFRAVKHTAVEEHLNSSTPTNLQDIAGSLQKVADNGFTHNVKDLPFVKGLVAILQRSSNETWLGEMAQLPLFAGDAALRASLAENV